MSQLLPSLNVEGGSVRLVDIMGAETVVEGSISFVDLANSIVKLDCPL